MRMRAIIYSTSFVIFFFNKNFDFTTYSTDYFKRSLKSALKQLSNEEGILPHEAQFVSGLIKLKNEKLFVSIFFSIIEVKVSNFLFSRLTNFSNKRPKLLITLNYLC